MAVGELLRLPHQGAGLPVQGQIVAGHRHIPQLTPVGAGVHGHAASQGARNAVGKLQSGQPLLHGKDRQPGQRYPGAAEDLGLSPPFQDIQTAGGQNDKPVQAAVPRQHIGAVAQHKGDNAQLGGPLQGGGKLPVILYPGHQPHRTADAEGGVQAHRHLLQQFQAGTGGSQVFSQLGNLHGDPPIGK